MNSTSENDPDAIRSDIDETRQHMDQTIDALGDRLKGRHLVDEVLGLFRSDHQSGGALREKLSHGVQSASHSVSAAVRANPLPLLLIGAGVGWMIYNSRRDADDDSRGFSPGAEEDLDYETADYAAGSEPLHDRPLEHLASSARSASSTEGLVLEHNDFSPPIDPGHETASAAERAKQRVSRAGDSVRQSSEDLRSRARQLGSRVQERVSETYRHGRERVAQTVEKSPLGVGLAVLAAGVVVGLALPTPEKVKRAAGPSVARLRDRARVAGGEALEKGRRVVDAAGSAAKQEAQAQGLASPSPGSGDSAVPASSPPPGQPSTQTPAATAPSGGNRNAVVAEELGRGSGA